MNITLLSSFSQIRSTLALACQRQDTNIHPHPHRNDDLNVAQNKKVSFDVFDLKLSYFKLCSAFLFFAKIFCPLKFPRIPSKLHRAFSTLACTKP